MAGELVTLFNKRPGGQIVAIEMTRADAEHAISRWPFAWSTSPSPASFARWPWPPERSRGVAVEPANWVRPL